MKEFENIQRLVQVSHMYLNVLAAYSSTMPFFNWLISLLLQLHDHTAPKSSILPNFLAYCTTSLYYPLSFFFETRRRRPALSWSSSIMPHQKHADWNRTAPEWWARLRAGAGLGRESPPPQRTIPMAWHPSRTTRPRSPS